MLIQTIAKVLLTEDSKNGFTVGIEDQRFSNAGPSRSNNTTGSDGNWRRCNSSNNGSNAQNGQLCFQMWLR